MDTQTWAKIKTDASERLCSSQAISLGGTHSLPPSTFSKLPTVPLLFLVCVWGGGAPLFPAGSSSLLQLPLHPQVQRVPAAWPSVSLLSAAAFMVLHGRVLQAHRCFCSVLGHALWSCKTIPHVPSRVLLFLMSLLSLPASSASSSRMSPFWLSNYSSG